MKLVRKEIYGRLYSHNVKTLSALFSGPMWLKTRSNISWLVDDAGVYGDIYSQVKG